MGHIARVDARAMRYLDSAVTGIREILLRLLSGVRNNSHFIPLRASSKERKADGTIGIRVFRGTPPARPGRLIVVASGGDAVDYKTLCFDITTA